jgi:rhodanese-related sulfurtransferase
MSFHLKLKQALIAFTLVCTAFMVPAFAANQTEANSKEIKEISAKELKSWIDSGKNFQLVDARPKKYEEGLVIVGARYLPYDSDAQAIQKALPSKDAIIVAYCASIKCPASTNLSKQLISLGYHHVYKYAGGLDEWNDKGYPVGPAK